MQESEMTDDALADELLGLRKPVRNLDRFGNAAEAADAYAEVIGKKPIEFGKGRVLSRFTTEDLCDMLNWLYMPVKEVRYGE